MATTGKRVAKTATRTTAKKTAAATKPKATKVVAKKATAKKATATKATAKKTTAKKTTATRTPVKKTSAKHGSDPSHYTQPDLRDRLKDEILAGEKGGKPGQWSARKAQLLAHAYEAAGGGYHGEKSATQRHLDEWTHEQWTTADGKRARRGATTARYLPKKAWEELTPAEQRATDKKKRAASKTGKQFVANTGRAAAARRDATS